MALNRAAEAIKQTLSMRQLAERYGLEPNRAGFIRCPFHNEKTPSLKLYDEPGRGFHCFGCGAGGSVIDFVMRLFGIPFSQAIVRLNADFGLGLTNDRPDPRQERRLRDAQAEAKRKAQAAEREYMERVRLHRRLWQAKLTRAPAAPEDGFSPEYVEACLKLDGLDWWFYENPYNAG